MGDVLNAFLKTRGLIQDDKKDRRLRLQPLSGAPRPLEDKKECKNKNKEYTQELETKKHSSMINKIIEEKPKEKYIIKYFQERLRELDDLEEED